MKKYFVSCIALVLGLSMTGCPNDSSDANAIFITPEEIVTLSENGGAQDYYVFMDGAHDRPVQVSITNSDPARLSVDKTIVTFPTTSQDSAMESFKATCIDNGDADGDHFVTLTMTAVNLDADEVQWTRQITCKDDDSPCTGAICIGDMMQTCVNGKYQPATACPSGQKCAMNNGIAACVASGEPQPSCTPGQIMCIDASNYKTCDATTSTWSSTTTPCAGATPVCDMSKNTCVANPNVCQAVCNGDLIRRCDANGTLLDAAYCDAGKVCRTTNGISDCVLKEVIPSDGYVEVSKQTMTIYEGGGDTFTVQLATAPTSTVNVMMTVTDPTEGVLDKTALSFTKQDWANPQTVKISAPRDGEEDGKQTFQITFKVASSDNAFNNSTVQPIEVTAVDTESAECAYNGRRSISIRAMAANTTSGNYSSYSSGHGLRIFQATQPDIVMIQEFNWFKQEDTDASAFKLVNEAFPGYYVFRGKGKIPNGIISRYPIIDSGKWESKYVPDRDWNWSLIDLPGRKELLVLSVHLKTDDNKAEAQSLMSTLRKKVEADRSNGLEYYMMIGGDFNSNFQNNGSLKEYFSVSTALPKDQDGEVATNAKRKTVLDHVFVDKAFEKFEVPVEIGNRTYDHGHVFDSRVYKKHGELGDVPPVKADDSGAVNMQHMAVIRDFEFSI